MEIIQSLGLVMGAGWTSGVNLYATIAILGLSHNMGWIALPAGLLPIANESIILLAFVLYCIEFVVDKIPLADTTWDSFHTFIRPTGAAAMGYLAGTDLGPMSQTLFALLSGTLALNMHAVKASTRLAVNTSPEPFSNIAASLGEDAAVVGMFWFFIKHPWLALLLIAVIVVLSFFLLRLLWKFVRNVFRAVLGIGRQKPSDFRPAPQTAKGIVP